MFYIILYYRPILYYISYIIALYLLLYCVLYYILTLYYILHCIISYIILYLILCSTYFILCYILYYIVSYITYTVSPAPVLTNSTSPDTTGQGDHLWLVTRRCVMTSSRWQQFNQNPATHSLDRELPVMPEDSPEFLRKFETVYLS